MEIAAGKNEYNDQEIYEIAAALEYDKMLHLWKHMKGTKYYEITEAYLVNNESLLLPFEHRLATMVERTTQDKDVFLNQSWRMASDANLREKILENYYKFADKFEINENSAVKTIPLVHGVPDEKSAFSIASTGFAALGKRDSGFFGNGIYFTNNVVYAAQYSKSKNYKLTNEKNEKIAKSTNQNLPEKPLIVILSWVSMASIYPVTEKPDSPESLQGKAIGGGYDSHYTLVCQPKYYPVTTDADLKNKLAEFVVSQENQTLPKYILYLKEIPQQQ